ncbi:YcgL domain-containing protein [Ketobacter sp. MCCC 1A13808]|uniref:YcgL domain-containing protein n=1 Tax=Ketobacter sp. MCCC 1A13808 TaxID=2602738 RepID=UPI000F256ACC|nr:YcgL domain-containing protein [Ketobacter sp. MCCC 1A13808]MVF10658.1 YcgL domain-containing protein [Ketobacter sp. MCCC 1A13808]RLP56078.1 MAG: YcgL domain-containing protein [Ketobacter sp.]
MTESSIRCSVYRSPKKDGMYIYVLKIEQPFEELPEDLMKQFGEPGHVMDLVLDKDRKLARVNVLDVINGLKEKGYYLQMPPSIHGSE